MRAGGREGREGREEEEEEEEEEEDAVVGGGRGGLVRLIVCGRIS